MDDPYEEPKQPEVVVKTERQSIKEGTHAILARLSDPGYLPAATDDGRSGAVRIDRAAASMATQAFIAPMAAPWL